MSYYASEPALIQPRQRRRYAELLRHFAAGRLTNDEYEDRYGEITREGEDEAMRDVFVAMWHCYDDLRTHRLDGGHTLSKQERRRVAHWILFLRSDATLADVPGKRSARRIELTLVFAPMLALVGWLATRLIGWKIASVACALVGAVIYFSYWIRGASLNPAVYRAAYSTDGDKFWPFASRADLDSARRSPCYLCGVGL